MKKKIAIVGLGLIGGSFARAFKKYTHHGSPEWVSGVSYLRCHTIKVETLSGYKF